MLSPAKSRGFTLVELLIVVGVLTVLVGSVLVVLNPDALRSRSRDAKRIADLKNIQASLELYITDNNAYPTSGPAGVSCAKSVWENISKGPVGSDTGSSCIFKALVPAYTKNLEVDPLSSTAQPPSNPCTEDASANYRYNYVTDDNSSRYVLTAILETDEYLAGHSCSQLSNWSWAGSMCPGGAPLKLCYGVQNP